MTTPQVGNFNFRYTRTIEGQPAQGFEMVVNTGADDRMNVQAPPQQVRYHPAFARGRSMARRGGAIGRSRSLNFDPTFFVSSTRANSQQPPIHQLTPKEIGQLNRTKKPVNRLLIKKGSWDRQYQEFLKRELAQSTDPSNRSRSLPPLSIRTARERSRTPVQHPTGRERSTTPPPAERTAIAARSDRSIPNMQQSSFTASAPPAMARPTLARPTLPMPLNRPRFTSLSPPHSIKSEVVNHSQQLELPRASTTGPLALNYTPKNNTIASSVYATPTEVKPEPLSIQSPSTLISTFDAIETGDGRKGPFYEHVTTIRIHSVVDGKPLVTDQQLRVRTRNPNSRFELLEIQQDGKPLFLNKSNASGFH
ncbi:hypothetical protein M3Y94_00009300 [Aphelenchoides besseyi]|nr:hypothetical protein M3Y94_00009300 [Aphelenchoides besseyi]KAI6220732.1 hypothetical protein M3Y95_01027300 [Aphelenchoides besseyi]